MVQMEYKWGLPTICQPGWSSKFQGYNSIYRGEKTTATHLFLAIYRGQNL